ncbi:MAG: hypothetical protein QM711_12855 [Micropruina sp.]
MALPGRPETSSTGALDLALGLLDRVDHGLRLHGAKLELVFVDLNDGVGVEHVVEGHENGAGLLGALDDRGEGRRVDGDEGDRVVAGGDEVVDGGDLGGAIVADRDDGEFLELGLLSGRAAQALAH